MTWTVHVGLTLKDGTRLEPGDTYDGKLPRWVEKQGMAVRHDNDEDDQ